jgi:hypothetical protein
MQRLMTRSPGEGSTTSVGPGMRLQSERSLFGWALIWQQTWKRGQSDSNVCLVPGRVAKALCRSNPQAQMPAP